MGINLMRDLGFDETSTEVIKARELVDVYNRMIDALVRGREEVGMKQTEVAAKMGTSQSAVSDIENRNSDARFSTLLRYSQAIGAELEIEVSLPKQAIHSTKPEWILLTVHNAESFPRMTRARQVGWCDVRERQVAKMPAMKIEKVAA